MGIRGNGMERKKKVFLTVEFLLLFVMICLAAFSVYSYVGGRYAELPRNVSSLQHGWYYLDEGGRRVDVSLPIRLSSGQRKSVTLFYHIPDNRMGGLTLTTKGARYDLKIEICRSERDNAEDLPRILDCHLLYEYQDKAFARNDQMAEKLYCDAVLPLEPAGRILALTYSDSEDGVYRIAPVFYGTSSAVFWFHCKEDAPAILMVTAMAVLSLFAICVSVYLWKKKLSDSRFIHAALFMLICGIWCITDSSIVQRMTGLSPITNFVSFFAFMTMPIPMVHFIRRTGGMEQYRTLEVCTYMYYFNAVVQMILVSRGICQYIELLFVTHILLVGGITLVMVLMAMEYRRSRNPEILTILRAVAIVSFGGIVSLCLYWSAQSIHYEIVYEGGILIFMIYLLCAIVKGVVGNIKFLNEMTVVQRLSKVDKLTGMGNRNAFDAFMVEFEEKADFCKNACMMVLDINKLKAVNDRSGHSAGDELIISAARCIEHAFGASGHYFRTDGDEFYVVLVDPEENLDVLNDRLNQEIRKYNQIGRHRISMARGYSWLVERGVRKTLGDWKYEAEQELYQSKGWRRIEDLPFTGNGEKKGRQS